MSVLQYQTPKDAIENKDLQREYTKRLGERLKVVRTSKGLTQEKLALKSGLHLTYIGHLELGKYHPTVYVLWKISRALGVSMNELTEV